tara:strand:+ start:11522 stop:12223 length:702 start_codon:yes stop_codon:yes gene_type:complete
MADLTSLRAIGPIATPSISELVYEELYRRVVEHELTPGTKISEADVAQQLEVSRQPVRDAFSRLARLGFLVIRPQRATTIAPISVESVMQAKFIRSAIEIETAALAAERRTQADIDRLAQNIELQRKAVATGSRKDFHKLDDLFHEELCKIAGAGFAWSMIREKKGQMDRVRFFSLEIGAPSALADHVAVFDALVAGRKEDASKNMRIHLSRITDILDKLRAVDGSVLKEDLS